MSTPPSPATLPLAGLRVVELSHMVMGPTCGMILADLGAEVIKVEPPGPDGRPGDRTRDLTSTGAGFFAACSRNKKSVMLDLDLPEDQERAQALIATADVMLENFRPGALAGKGLDYATLSARHPRLIYCSLKGFLDGPYEHRTALDEVVQMMSGLAYMTGLPDRPLRAGAPVNDMMGGMFGALAVMAALRQRDATGQGQLVQSGLFENAAWLVSTHMMQRAVSGAEPVPMSSGRRAWGVYDIFKSSDGVPIFIGVVTERQWQLFTEAMREPALMAPAYAGNNARSEARETLIPLVASLVAKHSIETLEAMCSKAGLPFARVNRPSDLFDDPHLNANGGMISLTLPDGSQTRVPGLPIQFGDQRLGLRSGLPQPGEHTREVLDSLPAAPDSK